MKFRHRLRFTFLLTVISAVGCALPALAVDETLSKEALTCDVHGGSFVLDDYDLSVLRNSVSGDGTKITPEYFVRLSKRTSKLRQQICDTRALWRAIKAKTATNDDFVTYFPNWIVSFWSEEERKIVLDYQIELVAKNWK